MDRFAMPDDQARLHGDQERLKWRVARAFANTHDIERHYRARLIWMLEAESIGPIAVQGEQNGFDLLIAGYAVELKIARARARPRADGSPSAIRPEYYQALMQDLKNHHHLNGQVVIVVCVDRGDQLWPYVIPRQAVGSRRTIEISSHPTAYKGQWATWLKAWWVLDPGV